MLTFVWILLLTVCVVSAVDNSLVPRLEPAAFSDGECGIERIPLQTLADDRCFDHQTWHQRNQKIEFHKIWRRPQIGPSDRPWNRIKGGREAIVGEFPWTVLINSTRRACTGSILSKTLVLTAGHCFWSAEPNEDFKVWVGVDPPHRDRLIELEAEEAIFHECRHPYNCPGTDQRFDYDLALIRMKPITIQKTASYYRFNTVCYPKQNRTFDDFDVFKFSGWGRIPDSSNPQSGRYILPNHMQWSHAAFKELGGNAPGNFLHLHAYWDIGACRGDSGSPVVMQNTDGRYYQVGIMVESVSHMVESRVCGSVRTVAVNLMHPHISSWLMKVGNQTLS